MAYRGPFLAAVAALVVPLSWASATAAQDYPNVYADRCLTAELRSASEGLGQCQPPYAHFGLSGPSAIGDRGRDVDTTGSIDRARKAEPQRGRGRPE